MTNVAAEVGSTANQYEILAKLATGGMADIFLARGEGVAGVERYCVLKRILRDRASDAQLVQMFLDEARLAAQLQHPNIASVYDVGKLGDSFFFTMEYVHGETVRSLLQRSTALRHPLPLACALTIVAGTAAGLHHAHERNGNDGRALGIVHRDVSPSNIMISYEGNVKVVDFGVAKAAHRAVETLSGTVKGKISYLSPEQCRGERVDRRSDLFSLGIVMWEMLTGERLYRRASDFANMSAIVGEAAVPPSTRRPDIPHDVDQIVLRLLAKSTTERFQGADEVVDQIEMVAVRAGLMVSTAAVGRFVRELFGRRPEPWLELDTRNTSREPVTLTSEPVPQELALAASDLVEQQLANVAELSFASGLVELDDHDDPRPSASSASPWMSPTVPLGVLRDRAASEPPVATPTPSVIAAPLAVTSPTIAPPPPATPAVLAQPEPVTAPQMTIPQHPDLASSPANLETYKSLAPPPAKTAAPVVPSVLSSESQPVVAMGSPAAAATAVHTSPVQSPRRVSWSLVAVIGGAVVAGILAAWFTMPRGHNVPPIDAPAVTLLVPPTNAPAVARAAPLDAAEPPPSDAVDGIDATLEADIEIIDAGARRPVDAPRPLTPRHVASPSAASPEGTSLESPHIGSPPVASPSQAPQVSVSIDQLKALYQKNDYAEVVKTCSAGVTSEIAEICARAACKQGNQQRAEDWIRHIASEKAQLETNAHCQQDLQNRAAVSPPAPAPRQQPTPEDLAEVAQCGATVMNERRAPSCTRVACRTGARDKAYKWVAYIPVAQRAGLITQCKPLGIDLSTQKLDCVADPAACP